MEKSKGDHKNINLPFYEVWKSLTAEKCLKQTYLNLKKKS